MTATGVLHATFAENLAPLGTPEWWLAAFGLTNGGCAAAELDDADSDRVPAWQEWLADTVPTDRLSVLAITGITPTNGGFRVEWIGGTAAWQRLRFRPDLLSTVEQWRAVFTHLPPTAITNWLYDPSATNVAGFYRIEAGR